MTAESQPKKDFAWTKSYPVDVDWNAELTATTMPEMLTETVRKHADRPCLNFMGKTLTYAELDKMSDAFAKSLQEQGIKKGDRVGLCLPNTPFYAVAYYGAFKAGAAVVNFNPLYPEHEMEHLIKDSGCQTMVTVNVPHVQGTVDKMIGERTGLKKVVVCDIGNALPKVKGFAYKALNSIKRLFGKKDATIKIKKDATHVPFQSMLKNDGKYTPVPVALDDIAVFQYTGGTTGLPKAATLTHANLTVNLQQADMWFSSGKTDEKAEKVLVLLPFFHVFSMTVQMNLSLYRGDEIVMLPKFDLKELLTTITNEKPSMFAGVPTLYKAIIDSKDIGKYDLSSLKICVSGGDALPPTTIDGFKKLTGLDLIEGYGLSETSPLATANPIHRPKKLASVGLPMPRTEVRIVDIDFPDREVPITVEGEICLKGPQVMKGYWNKPAENAESIDKDGFFHTGDLGHLDSEGYLFITGRKKDMIVDNGMKIFPRKVEEAILKMPGVSEVMVIGVKHELRGEVPKAFIVMKNGQKPEKSEIVAFLQSHLAKYEIPKHYEYRDSLPKTAVGKPDKKPLKAEEKAKEEARAKNPKPPTP
jgi:long-chain acyl-CoA synthetase